LLPLGLDRSGFVAGRGHQRVQVTSWPVRPRVRARARGAPGGAPARSCPCPWLRAAPGAAPRPGPPTLSGGAGFTIARVSESADPAGPAGPMGPAGPADPGPGPTGDAAAPGSGLPPAAPRTSTARPRGA